MPNEFDIVLHEYAEKVVERAKSNLRIKRRVRGKVVNRVASGQLLNYICTNEKDYPQTTIMGWHLDDSSRVLFILAGRFLQR